MALAHLACGNVLAFATRNICPAPGERTPCLRHGYCRVQSVAVQGRSDGISRMRRRRRREVGELIEYLRRYGSARTNRLRREGFTLRIVYDAARSGAVRLTEHDEVVAAAPTSARVGSGSR